MLDAILSSARCEEHYQIILNWFNTGFVHDLEGNKIEGLQVSKGHKHQIVQRVYSSETIPLAQKEELMAKLAAIDSSDWLTNTKKVCEAALPENKEKMWRLYFTKDKQLDEWALNHFQNSFRGWNQVQQRKHTAALQNEFFDLISDVIASRGRYVAESFFYLLRPMLECDDAAIKKYEDLLSKVQKEQPDNTMFIRLLKTTIHDLNVQQRGREASRKYLEQKK